MVTNLNELQRQSVQDFQPKDSIGVSLIFTGTPYDKGVDLLPVYGSHYRDRYLRDVWYRSPYGWLAQSAVKTLVSKVRQTPWRLRGGKNLTNYYQRLMQEAQFGEGWGQFIGLLLLDYLTCDYGAYVEVIGAGKSDTPLRGRASGIAALDSLRTVPTGNLEYPVIYYSRVKGEMHRMHHTRVYRWYDMPDNDSRYWAGVGMSALSRAVSIMAQQIPLQEYIVGMLKDTPLSGILYNKGISDAQWKSAYEMYQARRQSGYKGFMVVNSAQDAVEGNVLNFSAAPEGFDYNTYLDIIVNSMAAAFGIDRQDLFPLQGKMSGTATQSAVLAEKARGMSFGDILKALERLINISILPPAVEFEFEYEDDERDTERANRNATILNTALGLRGLVPDSVVLQFLANQADEFRQVLVDSSGELITLPDDDVRTDAASETPEAEPDAAMTDDTQQEAQQGAPAQPEQSAVTADDGDTDNQPETDDDDEEQQAAKAIQATRLDFENNLEDIFSAAQQGELTRVRFGVLLRAQVARYGSAAYRDGLIAGGVPDASLSDEDNARVDVLIAEQAQYIRDLADTIYKGRGITETEVSTKPKLWFNKSIQPFFDAGLLSANRNGNYEWALGRTEEHCSTCRGANGQIHRLRDWHKAGILPQSSALECKGYNCDCKLTKTDAKARGRLTRIKQHTH